MNGLGGVCNRTYFNAVDELKVSQVSDSDKRLEKGRERETDLDIHKFGNSWIVFLWIAINFSFGIIRGAWILS